MGAIVVVGCQWGDEGKGKIVDCLANRASHVVRFQGGNNAGHTIVVGDKTIKLSLVPSGIMNSNTRCLIGAGTVVNLSVLWEEIETLREHGVSVDPLRIGVDYRAHLVLEYHKLLDKFRELKRGKGKIGTTGRGIGPAYEDRVCRGGIRVVDLFNIDKLFSKLEFNISENKPMLEAVLEGATLDELLESEKEILLSFRDKILPYVTDVSYELNSAVGRDGSLVVFEGAQGTLLDVSFGTYPYVTSSSTISGAVCSGVGIGSRLISKIIGIFKAYCTRVGAGPFPTEFEGKMGDMLRERGGEYGTVTGRPRRVGWFDAVLGSYSARLNGCDEIVITKLDCLTGIGSLKLAVRYKDNSEYAVSNGNFSIPYDLEKVEPIYEEFAGWEDEIGNIREWENLPMAAKEYLVAIEDMLKTRIVAVSVGASRDQILFRDSKGEFVF